jgi:hypothetical protein
MYETLFAVANLVLPFWMLMMFLPKWKVTRFVAQYTVVPVLIGVLYVVGLITAIAENGFAFMGEFGSAEGVIGLLADPGFALIAWIHLLCFDMAVGHYIFRDNMKHRYVPLPVQAVILFLTLMFGPLGFLCYVTLRRFKKRLSLYSTTST